MPPQEQAELWMQLRDRMKVDWHEMTMQEKKAGTIPDSHNCELKGVWLATQCLYATQPLYENALEYYISSKTKLTSSVAWWIAFGPHGPRAETPPGEWTKVFLYTAVGIAASGVLFYAVHSNARPQPRTMTKEWQEATNEYLKVRHPLAFTDHWLSPYVLWLLTYLVQKERSNPIYGISSEGYTGKGHVQSKSAKARGITLDPDE